MDGPKHVASREARWEQRAEVPLAVASLLYLSSYAVRVLGHDLPAAVRDLSLAMTLAMWALFVIDYAVRWRLSGAGPHFPHRHWLDTMVVLLPLLRPLRFVRLYEAVQRRHGHPRLVLQARVMIYAGLSAALLGCAGALTVYHVEHAAPDATIRTFGDASWWTVSTLATVGYGDVVPVTPLGRLVAVGVMGCGLGLLGSVTGSFSSWLLQVFAREGKEQPTGAADDGTDGGRPLEH
ncbi:potassium channel family protein [Streptomyces phyllanthi]|uniref:potassium channel family protein n=1 Tax=Streptomyces phyllanthi TaxID=1803180 RepID=UPI002AD4026C|nr:potassium channel family protein [Streptomyces phyllanthi]